MFTINIYVKFALIAIGFILGILLISMYGFWYGFPFLFMGIIMLASYLMLGTIQSAGKFVEMGDFAAADKRLNLTATPKLLYVTNRAVYYIMKGSIAAGQNNSKVAEEYFQTALSIKLPSDDEKAMVLLQLANLNANKQKWTQARNYYKEAKKLKVTQQQIKDQIAMFDRALGNQGQMKAARSMGKGGYGMMQRSGKRRRPKGR